LHEEGIFKNGQKDGIYKWYYKNGNVKYKDIYQKGQKINRKAYDMGGKLKFNQDYPILE
jgi:antitoxin component YwqK of YwqJK toxin-antitoxin module